MTGCNMDMYIMNRKMKMLEYVSVCKIQVSISKRTLAGLTGLV